MTLYMIYRQISIARDVSAYEFLRKEDEVFESAQMKDFRSKLARHLMQCPGEFEKYDEYASAVCDWFENLGFLLRKNLAPDYLMWTMYCDSILSYWTFLQPSVDYWRKKSDDPNYYSEFEYLYRAMLAFERTMRKDVTLIREQRRDFLRLELQTQIRAFRASDLSLAMEIEHGSFDVDAYTKDTFQVLHEKHPDSFFVVEIPGTIIGYVVGYMTGNVGEIDSMARDPHYRGLGVGKRLLDYLSDYLKAKCPELRCYSLEVRITNKPAIALYRKAGFEVAETLSGYYSDGGDAYLMQKRML